jgi:UDP-3-O-acyl N-acetylglucosamine deacetylase
MYRRQSTIETPVQVSGFGFWSGRDVTIEFRPAAANTGIVFVRADLPHYPRVPAVIHYRAQGPRRTTLVYQGCAIELVEHVMAALSGMQIDNCEVWVNRQEIPGCDGSSQPFVQAIKNAGRKEFDAPRCYRVVESVVRVGDENAWIQAEPSDSNEFEITYNLDYPNDEVIGKQTFSATLSPEIFTTEIAPARTFVLVSEAEQMRKQGLGTRVQYSDMLIFGEDGLIQNKLRFPDECARHKLLDMVGDFGLLNSTLIGKFTAYRSGHWLNAMMAFALLQNTELRQLELAETFKKSA